jgi:hypothetical protein
MRSVHLHHRLSHRRPTQLRMRRQTRSKTRAASSWRTSTCSCTICRRRFFDSILSADFGPLSRRASPGPQRAAPHPPLKTAASRAAPPASCVRPRSDRMRANVYSAVPAFRRKAPANVTGSGSACKRATPSSRYRKRNSARRHREPRKRRGDPGAEGRARRSGSPRRPSGSSR